MTIFVPTAPAAVSPALSGPQPSDTDLLMAAATMQDLGRGPDQPQALDTPALTKAHIRRRRSR